MCKSETIFFFYKKLISTQQKSSPIIEMNKFIIAMTYLKAFSVINASLKSFRLWAVIDTKFWHLER